MLFEPAFENPGSGTHLVTCTRITWWLVFLLFIEPRRRPCEEASASCLLATYCTGLFALKQHYVHPDWLQNCSLEYSSSLSTLITFHPTRTRNVVAPQLYSSRFLSEHKLLQRRTLGSVEIFLEEAPSWFTSCAEHESRKRKLAAAMTSVLTTKPLQQAHDLSEFYEGGLEKGASQN